MASSLELRKVLLVREATRKHKTFDDPEVERGFTLLAGIDWSDCSKKSWRGWEIYYGIFMKEWENEIIEERKIARKTERHVATVLN